MANGKLIVFEGIDGCGKTTTIDMLADKIQKDAGLTVATYKFPNYETTSGKIIKDILYNKTDVIQSNLCTMFSINRFENKHALLSLLATHDYVILDRYVLSNVIYSSVIDDKPIVYLEEQLFQLEFDILAMPKWDQIYLLDISMEHLLSVIQSRSSTGDKHDTDFELLLKVDTEYKNYFKKHVYPIIPFTNVNLRVDLIYDNILSI